MRLFCPICARSTSSKIIEELRRNGTRRYLCKGCAKQLKLTDLLTQAKEISQTLFEFGKDKDFLTVIMFADVVQFAAKTGSLSDTQVNKLMAKHEAHARRFVARHKGWFWKTGAGTGDQTRAFFRGPTSALNFARQLVQNTGVAKFDVRVALLSGYISVNLSSMEPQRSNYFSILSRMMECIPPHEIWICERTKAYLEESGGVLGEVTWEAKTVELRDLGTQTWWKFHEL